jgi:hemerythrin-like domain-containing protein
MTTAIARPDTSEMIFVHNSFRQQFRALPGLVRSVDEGDTARAAVVVTFLEELTSALHHHHEGEDELMWPLLLKKAPMDSALILRMEEQHERIAELYRRAADNANAFASTADAQSRENLADTLNELIGALEEHLHDEEVKILPLVEEVMTVPQWEALGERGRAGIPKDKRLVFLGFMLAANPPDRGQEFLGRLPVPARIAWKLLGRKAYVKEYRKVYGADPA